MRAFIFVILTVFLMLQPASARAACDSAVGVEHHAECNPDTLTYVPEEGVDGNEGIQLSIYENIPPPVDGYALSEEQQEKAPAHDEDDSQATTEEMPE